MAFVPATNVAQAELIYSCEGQVMENVLHYQRGGGWTTVQLNNLVNALASWWNIDGKGMCANEISLVRIKVTDLTTDISPVVEYVSSPPVTGTWAGGVMPGNVAACATKFTANRGRSYRGRMFIPGLPDSQVAGSYVAAGHVTLINTKIATLLSFTIDSVVTPMVVVSRFSNGSPRSTAVVSVVTSIVANSRVDSQRRRLPGVGA